MAKNKAKGEVKMTTYYTRIEKLENEIKELQNDKNSGFKQYIMRDILNEINTINSKNTGTYPLIESSSESVKSIWDQAVKNRIADIRSSNLKSLRDHMIDVLESKVEN